MKKGIIAASILCLMLSGCGKKSAVSDDFTDVQGSVATAGDSEDVGDTETSVGEAEHVVNFTVSTIDEYAMTADLVIDTRLPEHVTTMKVKQVAVDEEYLTSLAKNIFDGGEYEVLKVKGYSLEESDALMLGILDSVKEKADTFGGVFEPSPYYGYLSESQASEGEGEYSEGQIILSGSVEVEDSGNMYVCYQERAFIKGNIDGKAYIMEYSKQDYEPNDAMYRDYEDIIIYPMDGRQIYFALNDDEADAEHHADNKISYNSAVATAEQYIEQLGFDNYLLDTVNDLVTDANSNGVRALDGSMITGELSSKTDGYEKNGYRLIFTPGVDGMQIPYCAGTGRTTMEYDNESVLSNAWNQPAIQVDIDATGIRGIYINSVYEQEEILSDDSNLISFEKANEIAKKMYSETYEENYEIGDIQFNYIIVKYDNETVMVPAWVYYRSKQTDGIGVKFAVNALDGSVVHFDYNFDSYIRWFR